MKLFQGVIPALLTPYDKAGKVHYASVKALVERLVAQEVGGLFVCGSTGEWWLLTPDERKRIVETVIEAVKGRTRVMVHVGSASTDLSIELARHAEKSGADAVSALPPVGFPYDAQAVWDHFRAIGESSRLPLYLYHLPQVYGDLITIDKFVQALDTMPTLAGAKFSSYRIDDLMHLKLRAGDRLNILSGCAEQVLSATVCGADGSICTWYNFLPRIAARIMACAKNGEMDQARELQYKVVDFSTICITNPIGYVKHLVSECGIETGLPRRPLSPPTTEDCRNVAAQVRKIGMFEWSI